MRITLSDALKKNQEVAGVFCAMLNNLWSAILHPSVIICDVKSGPP
jgi:hypothetical protein